MAGLSQFTLELGFDAFSIFDEIRRFQVFVCVHSTTRHNLCYLDFTFSPFSAFMFCRMASIQAVSQSCARCDIIFTLERQTHKNSHSRNQFSICFLCPSLLLTGWMKNIYTSLGVRNTRSIVHVTERFFAVNFSGKQIDIASRHCLRLTELFVQETEPLN